MKKTILVLMGGISEEKEISILSGRACVKALKKKKYKVKVLDPKGNFINEIRKIKPKVVFNALHGRFGEDGYVQSILENLLNTELFAEEIYYLSSLPSEIKYEEIILVFITSLLITIFSTIFPALRSAKIDPITSIRNE